MDLHTDPAKLPRKISNHFACVSGVSIYVNCQDGSASRIEAYRGSQNLRLPHQVGRDLSLDSHNRPNSGMSIVQNAGWRRSRRHERKNNKGNWCKEYKDDAKESIS